MIVFIGSHFLVSRILGALPQRNVILSLEHGVFPAILSLCCLVALVKSDKRVHAILATVSFVGTAVYVLLRLTKVVTA